MAVDPGSRGWNEHTHVTVERPTDELVFENAGTSPSDENDYSMLHMPGGTQHLCMHVPDGGALVGSHLAVQIGSNASFNGTSWTHFNPAAGATLLQNDSGSLIFHSSGAGSIAWTPRMTVDSGGAATFTGGVTAYGLTSTGNASVAGTLSAGALTTPSLSWTSRASTSINNPHSLAALPGGTGPFELGVSGGGAAGIAFHRHGYYAAHFGLDTDNNFRIGGWSLGNASYKLLDERDLSTTAAGNKIVVRDANGYIFNTYVNLSADVQGGAPVYVAGQNGDGYLRWYPKSSVGPPGLMETWGYFGAGQIGPGATVNRTTGIHGNGCGVTHDGTSIYVQRYGWYVISARSYSGDNTWDDGRYAEMRIMTAGGNVGGNHCANPKGGSGTYVQNYAKVLLNVGGQIYFQHYQNVSYTATWDGGSWSVIFIPTSGAP